MIFDGLGLPKDNGATDLQDSARLAGLLTVVGWPQKIHMIGYLKMSVSNPSSKEAQVAKTIKYVRHPREEKYNFSRDQAVCLMAGFFTQGLCNLVNKDYIDGKDIFSPSQNGHVRICQGLKPRWYHRAWFWLDILYSCYISPKSEPNQLICMMLVHPNKNYLKYWVRHNKYWEASIVDYWSGWRNEPELSMHMIKHISKVVGEA